MTAERIDDRLERVASGPPGVAIVVVGPEGVRARGSIGYADLATKSPMTANTAMPWFSMTKIATATLVLSMANEGGLDLDSPVIDVVPEVSTLLPKEWGASITPRHLLQHSAGLKNPVPVRWIHPASQSGPDPDAFLGSLLLKNRKLRTEPGSVSSYSNLGALVLAAAMVRKAGTSFESLMQERILDPLGMSSTAFDYVPNKPAATGYHMRWNPLRYLLPRWAVGEPSGRWLALKPFAVNGPPYGGLIGTAEDAAKFLQMHLADGTFGSKEILPPAMAKEMCKVTIEGKHYDLGLGWFRPTNQRNADPTFVEHLGGGAGFFNVMRAYPTEGVGAVVMGNVTKYNVDVVAELALRFRWAGRR